MDVCLVSVECCRVEVSATGRSLVQRSPTECGVPLSVIQFSCSTVSVYTCCELGRRGSTKKIECCFRGN
jgi:hypothetical protein